MYSIVFVKGTEFNVRISPTLCEQCIYIRFGTKSYKIVGIPMGTKCASLVADLYYFATNKNL